MKARCSQLYRLMTDARSGNGLSETAKEYVRELWIAEKLGRTVPELTNKYVQKGIENEQDSLELYQKYLNSKGTNVFVSKNKKHFENDYLTGTPDTLGADVKSCWSIHTFMEADIKKEYYWQLLGYSILTEVPEWNLVYTLTNCSEMLISDELKKIAYWLGDHDCITEKYKEMEKQTYKNMTFDDIPELSRVKVFPVAFKIGDKERVGERVKEARKYYDTLSL